MPRATTSSMTRKRLATSFMTKAEVKSIRQFALDWKCIGARDLDLPIIVLRVVWECRRNSKHQLMLETSYHISRYGNPCKLDPCPSVCYLHVLTKAQGKETWALPEILPRLWTTIWQRKAIWKTYFQTNAQELSTLCIYPENS